MKNTYKVYHESISKNGVEEYFNNDISPKYGVMHQYVMGLQAYIIKPNPADIQCNKGIINIQTIYPSIAAINQKFWNNKKLMKEESSTHKIW